MSGLEIFLEAVNLATDQTAFAWLVDTFWPAHIFGWFWHILAWSLKGPLNLFRDKTGL